MFKISLLGEKFKRILHLVNIDRGLKVFSIKYGLSSKLDEEQMMLCMSSVGFLRTS